MLVVRSSVRTRSTMFAAALLTATLAGCASPMTNGDVLDVGSATMDARNDTFDPRDVLPIDGSDAGSADGNNDGAAFDSNPSDGALDANNSDTNNNDANNNDAGTTDVGFDSTSSDGASADVSVDSGSMGCPAGQARCGGGGMCIDVQSNRMHCGACDNACPAMVPNGTAMCRSGACNTMCNPRFGDCNMNTVDGCETSLDNALACGRCGNVCGGTTPICARQLDGTFGCQAM